MINEITMKQTSPNSGFGQAEYVTAGKKRYAQHFSFKRKDAIITYIEIVGATAIALFAAAGIYQIFS
ncbi:hypothetical protein AMR72_05780 [Flavobacterium psychrophilum]|nr:hypothetical protein AMR72_05780 [Flavobacterium psychrophilum]AOE52071.1 hypothetical protein ALW18_05775 [Flavobacterium psychrophilum]